MPKKTYDEFVMSEYGNWNVASDYARLKIMKQLYLADEYEVIATFGFSEFMDELQALDIPIDVLKIRGFKRLVKCLMMVIDNSQFAVKDKHNKTLKNYREELERYWKILPTLFSYKRNDVTKTRELKLEEKDYNPALERVIEIKSSINEPLNRYDLIFTHKEEFDSKKAKELIKAGLIATG